MAVILEDLETALHMPADPENSWWSGSIANGSCDTTSTCNGWTSNLDVSYGMDGLKNSKYEAWIYNGIHPDNELLYVICIAY